MIISTLNTFCHETESFSIHWANSLIVYNVYDILHVWIFCPFSDVLCIFADNFPNLSSMVNCLKHWAIAGRGLISSELNVMIMKHDSEVSVSLTHDLFAMQDVQFNLDQKILKNFYLFIKVLYLANKQISLLVCYWWLKELLWKQMNKMWNVQLHYQCLYSVMHLNKFFQMIISQTVSSIFQPFNFITANQLSNEVNSAHINHLTLFLWLGMDYSLLNDIMTNFIISTILLDVYPPKMHHKWHMIIL